MNILFTGIGGPTPLGLARSVKTAFSDFQCIGVDSSPWSPHLYNSDIFDSTHQILNATAANYWEVISKVIDEEAIDFAFIVPETEVIEWSRKQLQSKLPCKTFVPEFKLASFCFDKFKVAQLLYPLKLSPRTLQFNMDKFQDDNSLALAYPFWIRIKSGAGALGALKISSSKELDTWLSLHDYRNDFIISEYLPGRNYACKLLFKNGKLIQHASAERIEYLLSAASPSGISGMCARGKLLNRPDLVEKSFTALREISNYLQVELNGIFTVDFKENWDAEPLITEVNIRHVSFNYAFTLGGINFPATTLREFLGIKTKPPTCFQEESYFIRGIDAPIRLVPHHATERVLN